MKAFPIVQALVLVAGITGCAGSSTGSLPATPPPHGTSPSASKHHLSTKTTVVKVKKSIQQQRRTPKDNAGGPPLFTLLLLDAPLVDGQDAQVNIGLVGINALSNGVVTPVVAYSSPQVVNLLTLENTAQQYAASLPAGSYDTLQLVVDPTTSSVVYQGATYATQFGSLSNDPTAYVGINAPATFTTTAGAVTVTADFNVFESVDLESGVAYVNPQVVTAIDATDVSGTVLNAGGTPVTDAVVLALDGNGNVLNSTVTANDGTFTIQALAPGTASVVIVNSYVSASGEIVNANGADATPPGAVPITLTGGTLNVGTLTD